MPRKARSYSRFKCVISYHLQSNKCHVSSPNFVISAQNRIAMQCTWNKCWEYISRQESSSLALFETCQRAPSLALFETCQRPRSLALFETCQRSRSLAVFETSQRSRSYTLFPRSHCDTSWTMIRKYETGIYPVFSTEAVQIRILISP